MKNFTYRTLDEKENLEAILRWRRRKLNRQQILSGCILATIISIVLLYCGRQIYYTEYDGYMHVDVNRVRAPYDIYLDSIYVSPGKIIDKGDTLFSYYIMDWLVMDANPNDEPEIRARRRSLTLQYTSTSQQIGVLDVKIAELKKQIATESHNIQFGLSENAHKLDLERELLETEAQKKALRNELGVLGRMMRETDFGNSTGTHNKGQLQIYENPGSNLSRSNRRYYISDKNAFVVNVHTPIHMVLFEKEDIISLQHLDLQANNLQVLAYIPIDKAYRIKNKMRAEVIVDDDLSFSAHVVIKGVRSELIPEHLRSFFAKQNTALIAILEIDEGQIIPFWSTTSGLPVKIRIKNIRFGDERTVQGDEMQYEVGRGFRVNTSEPDPKKNVGERTETAGKPEKANKDTRVSDTGNAGRFRIITNVFKREENAVLCVSQLRDRSLTASAKMYRSGQWYVYCSAHNTLEEAREALNNLVRTTREYNDAWILDTHKPEKR